MTRILRILFTVLLLYFSLPLTPASAAQNDDLQNAAEDGNIDRIRALIDKGADVNAKDTSGKTSLMYAAARGHIAALNVLMQKGADVNAKATNVTPNWQNGWTALMYAANHGNCDAVRVLLEKGSNANATADDGATALSQATGCRDDILRASQRTDQGLDVKNDSGALISAAFSGDAPTVRTLLDSGADVNAKGNDSATALMIAAVMGHGDVLHVLLEKGAEVNARTNAGETALLLAIENTATADNIRGLMGIAGKLGGNSAATGSKPQPTVSIVRALLDKSADVNARTSEGGTALMYAAQNCDEGLVKLLLDRGAHVNATTNAGVSALMVAQGAGCGKIAKQLRTAGGTK